MRSVLMVLAAAVSMALLACEVAVADTVTTGFEPPAFTPGSVDGQDGWKSAAPGDVPALPEGYDQEVVTNSGVPTAFGLQSLRMSNAFTNGEFFFQTYSRPVTSPAGENQANTEYTAEFSFISKTPNAEQPGLFLSVSPDSNEGSRMSWVGLEDTPTGIRARVADTPEVDGHFKMYDAGLLDRTVPHTIKFWIKLNPGADNDLVRIAIDGVDLGQCFTTWENYYRTAPEQAPPPNRNTPATINSLQFRSSGVAAPDLRGGGYLFDNVTVTTANGPGPAGCPPDDIDVDKTTATRFARPGHLVSYRITVRNRGAAPVRRLRACDRVPRALRFVGARPRLHRAAGRGLCLTIRVLQPGQRKTFRATFRLRSNVTADIVTNGATADTPSGSKPSPSPPNGPGRKPRRKRVARAAATIGVLAAARACPAALTPRAHAAC